MRALAIAILLLALAWSYAYPHDAAKPELNGWFSNLQSKAKDPCCSGSDALRIDDADWESINGHYRVRIQDEWIDVPDSAVVEGPNRAGPTMVWPVFKDGHPTVRCFMPGEMT
jgi:hypothetical protein